jgi:predicted DNA-binding transcriptional regulator AlpA
MAESNLHNSLAEALTEILKGIVKEAVQEALASNGGAEEDRFLDAKEAARLLSVSEDWLFRYSRKLPFARKLGPKMLRFSYNGIQKYLAARKLS